jgi:hypothetical protein
LVKISIFCLGLSSNHPNVIVWGLFGFICAVTWVFVCYYVVPKYIGVVIMYAPLTVGSSLCLCSSVVYHSVYADLTLPSHPQNLVVVSKTSLCIIFIHPVDHRRSNTVCVRKNNIFRTFEITVVQLLTQL